MWFDLNFELYTSSNNKTDASFVIARQSINSYFRVQLDASYDLRIRYKVRTFESGNFSSVTKNKMVVETSDKPLIRISRWLLTHNPLRIDQP